MKTLRLGTRKSALAQAQANWTADTLRTAFRDLHVEIVLITTSGDKQSAVTPAEAGAQNIGLGSGFRRNDDVSKGGLKALFTKEIEEALLDNRIDLAVHSLKDMSAILPKGLVIGAVPEREDPRDVWISRTRKIFSGLSARAKIGTGSVRRSAQLLHARPDLQIIPLRGNVETRLRKLEEGSMDGIVLALAGLKRLGLESKATEILPVDTLLPAVGQGCLGIQIRDRDLALTPFMKALDHAASHAAALCERAFLKKLSGTCQTPIAGHASIEAGELTMKGLVISPDGQQQVSAKETGRPFDAEGVGERLAQKLLEAGADKILVP